MADVQADPVHTSRASGAETVLDQCGDRLYALALRVTGVKEEAEAALDDALHMAAANTGAYPGDSAFASWLYLTVARAAHQRLRQRHQHAGRIALGDVVPALTAEGGHFEPMDDWSDRIGARHSVLLTAIDALPSDYRTALILSDVEGASTALIAESLGVDVPVVKSYVHRARLFVRKRLAEYFG